MGTPDDADIGIAFNEWFIETLITDDSYGEGDNDLSNGTPNADIIIESFNKHNIGTTLAMQLTFNHENYEDADDTENPYRIVFVLGAVVWGVFVVIDLPDAELSLRDVVIALLFVCVATADWGFDSMKKIAEDAIKIAKTLTERGRT